MTDAEYTVTLSKLVTLAHLIAFLDLDGFRDCAREARRTGPLFGPDPHAPALAGADALRLAEAAVEVKVEVVRQARESGLELIKSESAEGLLPAAEIARDLANLYIREYRTFRAELAKLEPEAC